MYINHFLTKELIFFLPEIILFSSSAFILLSSILTKGTQKIEFLISISCILLSIFALFYLNNNYENDILNSSKLCELGYLVSKDINNLKMLTLFLSLLIILSFFGYYQIQNPDEQNSIKSIKKFKSEYLALIIFSCLGIFSSISAGNFLSLFVSLELCSFCAYILCAIERKNSSASEASVKYFIMGAVMSCVSLFGISVLYGVTKAGISIADYDKNLLVDLHSNFDASYVLPIVLILANLVFKLGLFPFHSAVIDVYQGCPNYVVNFFGSINKIPAIAAIIFIKSILRVPFAEKLCILLSIISMLFGALGGIKQKSIKRIMGYSSMLNFGFVMYYLMSINLNDKTALSYLYLYILVYSTGIIGAFSILGVLSKRSEDIEDINVSDLSMLYKTNPYLVIAFVIFILSIMGIPPLSGFFVKYNIITFAIKDNFYFAVAALLSSVIAGYYYLTIIKTVIFDEPISGKTTIAKNNIQTLIQIPWLIYLSCFLCLMVNLFLFVLL